MHVYCTSTAASLKHRCTQSFQYLYTTFERIIPLFYLFMYMHALPGIVDGARKTLQVEKGRSGRFSSLPMLEATTSRDQCITPSIILCRPVPTVQVQGVDDKSGVLCKKLSCISKRACVCSLDRARTRLFCHVGKCFPIKSEGVRMDWKSRACWSAVRCMQNQLCVKLNFRIVGVCCPSFRQPN